MVQSIYITDKTLMDWQGAGAWRFDTASQSLTPVAPTLTGEPFLWFAVSSLQAGAWWLPTTSQTPPASWQELGGTQPLQAKGVGMWTTVNSRQVIRPTCLVWWVPRQTLSASSRLMPGRQRGLVMGAFPQRSPDEQPSQNIRIERIPRGVMVTIQGGPLVIDIEGGGNGS